MVIYSPDIPEGSPDFPSITHRYWNSLCHDLIFLGRMQRIFCSCSHSNSTIFFSFHLVPLLLGGQRRCGFKAGQWLSHMTSVAGIEPRTPRSRVQRINRSAMRSSKKFKKKNKNKTKKSQKKLFITGRTQTFKYSSCQ